MDNLSLAAQIEAVLFYKGESISKKKLSELIHISLDELESGLHDLDHTLEGRGLQLVFNNDDVMLGTAAPISPLIESLQKEEIARDLGKAGSETLAIVLYKGPISRREIDFIRGVNSAFVIRNLLVRGLIERIEGEGKLRGYLYRPTSELIAFMGLSKIESLPEFESVRGEMERFAASDRDGMEENNAE